MGGSPPPLRAKYSLVQQKCASHACLLQICISMIQIAGWEEERSGPTGKSFLFVRACVRAVIVKWE